MSRPSSAAGQQSDIGQHREASADAGIVIEHRDPVGGEQRAQAVRLVARRGLGEPEETVRECAPQSPASFTAAERRDRLHQGLGGAARFRDRDETRRWRAAGCASIAANVSASRLSMKCSRGPSRSAPTPGTPWPASCASVWPPRLDPPVPRMTMSLAPSVSRRGGLADRGEIVARRRQPKQRQAAVGVAGAQPVERRARCAPARRRNRRPRRPRRRCARRAQFSIDWMQRHSAGRGLIRTRRIKDRPLARANTSCAGIRFPRGLGAASSRSRLAGGRPR